MDPSLTCVVATHIYLSGGLCDVPTWSPTPLRQATPSSLDVLKPVETSLVPRVRWLCAIRACCHQK